jgi:predicted transcriptional regulator
MWEAVLGIASALLGITALILKYYLTQKTPLEAAVEDEEDRRRAGDEAIAALESRDLEELRKNIMANLDRKEAQDAVKP